MFRHSPRGHDDPLNYRTEPAAFYKPLHWNAADPQRCLADHPQEARAFLAALARGYEDAIADPDAAAALLIEQVPELASSEELVVESQRYLSGQYQADAASWGVIDPARWQAFYQWLVDNSLVEGTLDPASGFSNDYLPN